MLAARCGCGRQPAAQGKGVAKRGSMDVIDPAPRRAIASALRRPRGRVVLQFSLTSI